MITGDKLRYLDTKYPGFFELIESINPGACPQCGRFFNKLWHYYKDRSYSISTIVSCEKCAGTEE